MLAFVIVNSVANYEQSILTKMTDDQKAEGYRKFHKRIPTKENEMKKDAMKENINPKALCTPSFDEPSSIVPATAQASACSSDTNAQETANLRSWNDQSDPNISQSTCRGCSFNDMAPVLTTPVDMNTQTGCLKTAVTSAENGVQRSITLTNLPDDITMKQVTDYIRGGTVVDIFLKEMDNSCTVSFLDEGASRAFFTATERYGLIIRCHKVGDLLSRIYT